MDAITLIQAGILLVGYIAGIVSCSSSATRERSHIEALEELGEYDGRPQEFAQLKKESYAKADQWDRITYIWPLVLIFKFIHGGIKELKG